MAMNQKVLERVIDLTETGAVALMHIATQVGRGKLDDTVGLFEDFVEAFAEIERVLIVSASLVNHLSLKVLNDALRKAIGRLVECYENDDTYGFLSEMNQNVFTVYKNWQDELLKLVGDVDRELKSC